jgi:hypothetical protein
MNSEKIMGLLNSGNESAIILALTILASLDYETVKCLIPWTNHNFVVNNPDMHIHGWHVTGYYAPPLHGSNTYIHAERSRCGNFVLFLNFVGGIYLVKK